MKKILCILMLLPLLSMGQMSKEYVDDVVDLKLEYLKKPTKTSNNHAEIHPGVACMLGGATFMLLGFTTPNEGEFVDGKYQQKPLYRSGAPFFAVLTGGGLFLTGVVITIGQ
jgi:hypothetical protein